MSMSNPTDRVEIITSVQRHRRWTASDKFRFTRACAVHCDCRRARDKPRHEFVHNHSLDKQDRRRSTNQSNDYMTRLG